VPSCPDRAVCSIIAPVSTLQLVATIVGVAVGVVGLITFGASFWTARGRNQRDLRDRLRKQLRSMNLLCIVLLQQDGWEEVSPAPQVSPQALDQISDDGLLSPKRSHLQWLKSIVREIHDRSHVDLPGPPTLSQEEYNRLTATNERRRLRAVEILEADALLYLRALGKMDNVGPFGYFTYLRYRILPPHRRDTFVPEPAE
jgi:hypothetical protein